MHSYTLDGYFVVHQSIVSQSSNRPMEGFDELIVVLGELPQKEVIEPLAQNLKQRVVDDASGRIIERFQVMKVNIDI